MVLTTFQWIQVFFWCITALGVYLTWKSFKANQKLKRAEWIKSLFEKFYENEIYKNVRFWIDYDMLEIEIKNDINNRKQELLSDYLNFFEFIATLEKMNQLTTEEIKDLFAYYLRQIWQSEKCRTYINDYKFKNLNKLLSRTFRK